ncbi:phosphoadenosine phosphosulfate reductase domain-containing protein [Pyrococcus abyssi]|uniref:3'-phosphoadenosine 5'-phosphosulfate sulfotransferase (PAPS reductase), containing one PUA domain and 2 4Fe-4S binding domains n=1 Tax=Pyrococcus abyssi (strain GE5 / Orsay) TaxID=272844 RepID=Q9V229_PYRAB|nr:phosphoadenosine phosphosulfate reductase family protein [Pyrococcus abyssi]CAB49169.1 3'-phosphoadenosine 5'-phosphosulfate sulfotransferase (PAPS reductase), containing one PUA domain and 2 4Fe-4S binding domains [Pyrococcus abyssi GE5]CCE69621.1 TPA: phosphoadenosine phosphosulfate reductase family protein [Pyrococcus abyssi GE5]
MRKKGPVVLGRFWIYWCEKCNVPLISEKCSVHGEDGVFKITLTPPGDVRFAFERDIELIRAVFLEHYGVDIKELMDGKIVLLNKIPGEDDSYEIIFDGFIFGIISFDPRSLKWRPGLKEEGARLLWEKFGKRMKKWVIIDRGAVEPVKNGANVLPVGIIEAEESIRRNDEVIVVSEDGEVVGVGIAKKDYEELINPSSRGTGIKMKRKAKGSGRRTNGKKAKIEDVIRANSQALEEKVKEAKEFMRKTAEKFKLPVSVAFSGGKDSLAVLGLALEEFDEFTVFFNNTGIEFPETVEYVESLRKELEPKGVRFIVADAGDAFWRAVNIFSPPGMDYRWCCKVTKLGPITLAIKRHFPQGVLMFVGQRKFESFKRYKQGRVWRNSWVPNEIGAAPIFHWTALEVWLYIFSRKLRYNPLYERGIDRIGCFLCPSQSLAEIERLKKEKPELWSKWEKELEKWRKKLNLPKEWIEYGFWRWRKLGKREVALAKDLGVEIPRERKWDVIEFSIEEEGESFIVRPSTRINLRRIREVAPILGEVEEGSNYLKAGKNLFDAEKNIIVSPSHEEAIASMFLLKRAYECVGCGVCVTSCPENAIFIDEKRKKAVVIAERCTHCRECMNSCPLVVIQGIDRIL